MTGAELRASILQAAVQGKLVPQDPTDEPASVLLERIREERRALVKARKAKAPKGGESIITRCSDGTVWETRSKGKPVEITDEVPFDIPDGWEWARLESIIDDTRAGKSPKCKDRPAEDGEWGVLRTTSVQVGQYVIEENKVLPDSFEVDSTWVPIIGDVLITRAGPKGRTGVACLVDREGDVILSDKTIAFHPIEPSVDGLFIVSCLNSSGVRSEIEAIMTGMAASQVNISQSNLKTILIPIPPLAEQLRIVAKLDELMPLVERYDRLDRECTELNAGIEGAMRASVLQAAVQGRLTEREPDDEPASELLERIREERRALVKAGKAKVPKGGESVITRYSDGTVWEQRGKGKAVDITDEIPFDIPDRWEWARLGSLVLNRPQQVPSEPFNYLDISSINNKRQRMSHDVNRIEADKAPSRARKPVEIGDVVYATVRPYLHNACVVDFECELPMIASTGFATFRAQQWLNSQYLLATLISPFFDDYANDRENAKGVAYPAINDARLYQALIPVPPLAEQRRIVAKLDELLPKVERLGELAS